MLKKNILILFSIILVAIFAFNASAELTEDFTAYTQLSNVDACTCSTLQDSITITNTGSFVSAYTLSIEGSGANYSTLSETFLVLEPGESKNVDNIISLSCGKELKLNFNIVIETNTGLKKTIPQKINVVKCNDNKMAFLNGNSFTNEHCSITRYDLKLTNIGLTNELYNLGVEGLPEEYVSFSENPVLLAPQDSLNVVALVSMPCNEYGPFEADFTSLASESGFKVKLPFFLEIKRNYNYSLSFGKYNLVNNKHVADFSTTQANFCEGVKSAIPVKVSNNVPLANTYSVKENSKQSWISLDTDLVKAMGNTDTFFNIVLNPKKGDEGNYSIPIHSKSTRGDLVLDKSINIQIDDCSSFTLDAIDYDQTCCGANTYDLTVTNTGKRTNEIALDASNISLSTNRVKLAPKESKNVTMDIYVPCNESGVKTFNVNATVMGYNEFEEKTFTIDFVDAQTCHMVSFDKNRVTVFYESDKRDLKISSSALKESDYEVYLYAPSWINISESNFHLKSGENKVLTLNSNAPHSSKPGNYDVYVSLKADNGQIYKQQISVTLREKTWKDSSLEYLDNNKGVVLLALFLLILIIFLIIFLLKNMPAKKEKKVTKKEVSKKAQVKKKTEKKEKPTKNKKKKSFPWAWLIIFILLILVLLGAYLAYNKTSVSNLDNKTQENITTINESAANQSVTNQTATNQTITNQTNTIIEESFNNKTNFLQNAWENFMTWITPTPVNKTVNNIVNKTKEEVEQIPYEEQLYQYIIKNNLNSSFQYHSWFKNEVYTINLTPRFIDPDSDDVLEFTSTKPQHIDVQIERGMVYLTPEHDWTGVDYITFKATDSHGAQVITPEIALIVRNKNQNAVVEAWGDFVNFLKMNSMYILFGAILLIILILILSTGSTETKK